VFVSGNVYSEKILAFYSVQLSVIVAMFKTRIVHQITPSWKCLLFLPVFCLTIFCESCKVESKDDSNEAPPKSLAQLKATDFTPTIEHSIVASKNFVYAPTLVLAWNAIKDSLGAVQIPSDSNNSDLVLLNNSKAYEHALDKGEGETNVTISGDEVIAMSALNLQFTFDPFLEKLSQPLYFNEEGVEGFGMTEWDELKAKQLEIIYFKDNSNFIFKLVPKEGKSELVFIKGLNSGNARDFKQVLAILDQKARLGFKEKQQRQNKWKYHLRYGERFCIPELSFNLVKEFETLAGRTFLCKNEKYLILRAQQRNALQLNNKGAKIQSEATVDVACTDSTEPSVEIEKQLILDSTFFLIIKHNDRTNPYFCMKVVNTELMRSRKP
jgi:hypothetical protein